MITVANSILGLFKRAWWRASCILDEYLELPPDEQFIIVVLLIEGAVLVTVIALNAKILAYSK